MMGFSLEVMPSSSPGVGNLRSGAGRKLGSRGGTGQGRRVRQAGGGHCERPQPVRRYALETQA